MIQSNYEVIKDNYEKNNKFLGPFELYRQITFTLAQIEVSTKLQTHSGIQEMTKYNEYIVAQLLNMLNDWNLSIAVKTNNKSFDLLCYEKEIKINVTCTSNYKQKIENVLDNIDETTKKFMLFFTTYENVKSEIGHEYFKKLIENKKNISQNLEFEIQTFTDLNNKIINLLTNWKYKENFKKLYSIYDYLIFITNTSKLWNIDYLVNYLKEKYPNFQNLQSEQIIFEIFKFIEYICNLTPDKAGKIKTFIVNNLNENYNDFINRFRNYNFINKNEDILELFNFKIEEKLLFSEIIIYLRERYCYECYYYEIFEKIITEIFINKNFKLLLNETKNISKENISNLNAIIDLHFSIKDNPDNKKIIQNLYFNYFLTNLFNQK
ncbi:MAG: SMEK domain-containing protein [Cetobacterium sp.]